MVAAAAGIEAAPLPWLGLAVTMVDCRLVQWRLVALLLVLDAVAMFAWRSIEARAGTAREEPRRDFIGMPVSGSKLNCSIDCSWGSAGGGDVVGGGLDRGCQSLQLRGDIMEMHGRQGV